MLTVFLQHTDFLRLSFVPLFFGANIYMDIGICIYVMWHKPHSYNISLHIYQNCNFFYASARMLHPLWHLCVIYLWLVACWNCSLYIVHILVCICIFRCSICSVSGASELHTKKQVCATQKTGSTIFSIIS